MPRGAVRGDVRRQHFCPMCHVPRYFYVDQDKRCVECSRQFVFSARGQKHWYEELRFHFDSVAIRCLDCRRRQRTRTALHPVARAKSRAGEGPADASHALAVAEAIVRLNEHTGEGDLREAIAAARHAARIASRIGSLPGAARFWEGKAQALLGRHDRARPLLEAALAGLPANRAGVSIRGEARWDVESHPVA